MNILINQRRWNVSFEGSNWFPEIIRAAVNQNTPTIYFSLKGKKFSIEFDNRSDLMASRHGHEVFVTMISNDRSKRLTATAINKKL